ncbi:TauD/TfdA family dioxygenase [Burkholderia cepacia]|nr:TauD/TfdA family dioxygenase [Burkholderia cepacia]
MIALAAEHTRTLVDHGWLFHHDPAWAADIYAVAQLLGPPVSGSGTPVVQSLRPVNEAAARPNTTSSLYGLGEFPLHTDMAHWPLPPRYLVMRASVVDESVPTLLVDSLELVDMIKREDWGRALWRVSRVREPYLCSMFFQHRGESGIRWDVCTMSPHGPLAKTVAAEIAASLRNQLAQRPVQINWRSPDDVLILDNWRMLHARPAVGQPASQRTIQRVMVGVSNDG